jgi:hypothetical protein
MLPSSAPHLWLLQPPIADHPPPTAARIGSVDSRGVVEAFVSVEDARQRAEALKRELEVLAATGDERRYAAVKARWGRPCASLPPPGRSADVRRLCDLTHKTPSHEPQNLWKQSEWKFLTCPSIPCVPM